MSELKNKSIKMSVHQDKNVTFIKRTKKFTLDQAQKFIPRLDGITFMAFELAKPLMEELKNPLGKENKKDIAKKLQDIVDLWSEQIKFFGAIPKGLWTVDFDNGEGFYTWVYGQKEITSCQGTTQRSPYSNSTAPLSYVDE